MKRSFYPPQIDLAVIEIMIPLFSACIFNTLGSSSAANQEQKGTVLFSILVFIANHIAITTLNVLTAYHPFFIVQPY